MILEKVHCEFCDEARTHKVIEGEQVLRLKLPLEMPGGTRNPWLCHYVVCLHCRKVWHLAIREVRLTPDQVEELVGPRVHPGPKESPP